MPCKHFLMFILKGESLIMLLDSSVTARYILECSSKGVKRVLSVFMPKQDSQT